jgi:hypothetical protein
MHAFAHVMRYDDEQDPKKPHPVTVFRKGDNTRESQEHGPRNVGPHGRKDDRRDHHRHVHSC